MVLFEGWSPGCFCQVLIFGLFRDLDVSYVDLLLDYVTVMRTLCFETLQKQMLKVGKTC